MHFSPDNFHLQTQEVTGPRMDVFREAILELFEQEHEKLHSHTKVGPESPFCCHDLGLQK